MNTSGRRASRWMNDELEIFRASVRKLAEREFAPHVAQWTREGRVERKAWEIAAQAGILCASVPGEYGGAGGSFAHECIIAEELEYAGVGIGFSIALHNCIVAHYILDHGTEEQRRRWLPRMASAEIIGAVAMTEPGTGSDLRSIRTRAERHGERYRINGQKTFISNAGLADLIITVCRTDSGKSDDCVSLIAVETTAPGFRRGRKLDKMGLSMSETLELFYDDVEVPRDNLLGGVEGKGFPTLMSELPRERLIIAVGAVAAMERALDLTRDYVAQRDAFGRKLIDFQNTAFTLAECKTEAAVSRAFVDECIVRQVANELDAATASMAKWWSTEYQCRIIDRCLQLFGGYGYTLDYPISRMFTDARAQKIYGGTNEIMKVLISRTL